MAEKRLLEYSHSTGQSLKIDRERGIIERVKVLGERSTNPPPDDNEYPAPTRQQAINLLEGSRVGLNHPPTGTESRPRDYQDTMGVLKSVTEGGDGLYANWHFPPKHPLAEQVFWDAENAPHLLGFSINARGKFNPQKRGRCVIEGLSNLNTVDLVTRPATTKGLRESQDGNRMKTTPKAILEAKKASKETLKVLQEMANAGCYAKGMDAETEEPTDHNDALAKGFSQSMHMIVDDEAMSMDDKVKRIKELLKAHTKLSGAEDDGDEGGATAAGDEEVKDDKEKKTEESLRKLTEEGKLLREELAVRDLIADAGLTFKQATEAKIFAKSLVSLNADERKTLIESRKGMAPATRPGSGAPRSLPATGSKNVSEGMTSFPADRSAYLKSLRN